MEFHYVIHMRGVQSPPRPRHGKMKTRYIISSGDTIPTPRADHVPIFHFSMSFKINGLYGRKSPPHKPMHSNTLQTLPSGPQGRAAATLRLAGPVGRNCPIFGHSACACAPHMK